MSNNFIVGKRRRKIEDAIVAQFRKVDFKQKHHQYLEDDEFWDFVFSWYQLVKYYEEVADTAIGAHMIDLYQQCGNVFKVAANDRTIHERRRDKASDALYQMTYYVDRMIRQAERNGIRKEADKKNAIGDVSWIPNQAEGDDEDTASLN